MSQIIIYRSEDGRTKLDVRLEDQTVWLSQKQLTELFGKAKGTVSEHIKHIFEDRELEEDSVVRLFRTTAADGKQYDVAHYNLDMVLALGFRVRSPVAVRFRQWAADKLKEYIIKGFVLDDARLKNPKVGNDYFKLLWIKRFSGFMEWVGVLSSPIGHKPCDQSSPVDTAEVLADLSAAWEA